MANATDTRSPRSSSGGGGGGDSPQSRRNGKNTNSSNLSAPWSHVVRGESEAIPAGQSSSSSPLPSQEQVPDSMTAAAATGAAAETISSSLSESTSVIDSQMDSSDNVNINVAPMKKPAWNKPSNGVVEVGAVMGASSWPALSESAKASPKSSSDSLKALSDGSVSVTQGPVIASAPQKQVNSNANPNSTPNHAFPTRQKSMKRGTGGGGPVNGGFNQPPPLPSPSAAVETQQNSSGKPGPVVMDSSPRDPPHYKSNNNWEGGPRGGGFMSQPHSGNDHPQQHRNSFRRHNGPHPNSYGGGRHNQDRGNHEWNSHRNFNGRNVHMQQQRVPGNFQRAPPPSNPPFISPPVPPFPNPLAFPVYYVQGPPPETLRGMSVVPAPSMVYVPPPDAQLRARIIKQIDYYFSPENLCKDTYLRQNMDDQGWVSISVIAPWNRVRQLTTNIQLILDALRSSMVVEVQGDKLRKRNDWMNWPRLPQNQFVSVPVAHSSGVSNHDVLTDRFKNVRLEEGKSANVNITTRSQADTPADPAMSRSSTEDLKNLPSNVQWGGPEQATVRLGSD